MSEQYLTIEHLTTKELTGIFSRVLICPTSQCWIWKGSVAGQYNYGVMPFRGKRQYMHRLMYAWLIAPVPMNWRKWQVDHLCKNTRCCNPAHLELVTSQENNRRSSSYTAQNARKTHCKNGHLLEGGNLCQAPLKKGYRICRVCKNNYQSTPEARARKQQYRAANLEKIRAQNLATYHRHAETAKPRMRAYYHRKKATSSAN